MAIETAAIAAQTAVLRQNVALSAIRQSNDQAQAIAGILEEAARSIPTSSSRGSNINITA